MLASLIMRTLLLLPLLGVALASSDYKGYHGYKVLRTQVLDKASSDLLHSVMIEVCLLCFLSLVVFTIRENANFRKKAK